MLKEKKYDHYDQANIIKLLAEDSQYAFQLIFDKHRDQIYKVSLLYLRSPILSEEIVQDVFLKLWFKRKDLSGIICLEAWIYTVTKNLIRNYFKKLSHEWVMKRHWQNQHERLTETADSNINNAALDEIYNKALNTLSPQQKLIYKLAKEESMTYEQIALQLSISPLTVKTHLARAFASVRAYINTHRELLVLAGIYFL